MKRVGAINEEKKEERRKEKREELQRNRELVHIFMFGIFGRTMKLVSAPNFSLLTIQL